MEPTTAPTVADEIVDSLKTFSNDLKSGKPNTAKKKPVKKADKPKAAKKKADKPKKDDARKVTGLRRFQLRALSVLAASKDPMSIAGIAKKAKVSHTMIVMGMGTIEASLLKAHDKKMGFPSLLTLGHCRVYSVDGLTGIQITASGRKALTAGLAALKDGKLPKVKTNAAAA